MIKDKLRGVSPFLLFPAATILLSFTTLIYVNPVYKYQRASYRELSSAKRMAAQVPEFGMLLNGMLRDGVFTHGEFNAVSEAWSEAVEFEKENEK